MVHFPKWDITFLLCSWAHVMQTQQSFSSLSTPESRWMCCLSLYWSKIHCTQTEPSGPTPGHQGWGGAGSRLTETLVWASCRRTGNKMPPRVSSSSGRTGGWRGRLLRGRRSSKLQELCRWSVLSLCWSHLVRWKWSCQSGLLRLQWGAKCGLPIIWHWRLIWAPLHTHRPAPSPPFLLGHLCPRSGLALLSHLEIEEQGYEQTCIRYPHIQYINQIKHLGLLCPLSLPSPPVQHLFRPSHLSPADQDCHVLQESLGCQADQCTDWEGSCCLLTGWKGGLGGWGGCSAGATAWVRSLQCQGCGRKEEYGKCIVYKQVCVGVTPNCDLDCLQWDNSDQIKQKCTTDATINITPNHTLSDYRSREQHV